MIRAEGLRKSYGERVAVDGVDLHVAAGQTFGLLGPNGAGKTTTIHMLVGMLAPDAGSVEVAGGKDPTRPAVRAKVGIVPQALAIYGDLTARENLEFFGKLYALAGRALDDRVTWCLEFAGLADRAVDRVKTFSGGMQRRLNMACALVHDPEVIFFDEPTVGVDPQSREHIFEAIESLKRKGRTILYTTHYMEEAARLCDRVAIMDKGKILAAGAVHALIDRHGGPSIVDAEVDGETLRIETDQPLEEVARLARAGGKLTRLHVDRPDLEAVFLKLTGRKLRD
jgi:ABC-2 type transport system ATP-binding protein